MRGPNGEAVDKRVPAGYNELPFFDHTALVRPFQWTFMRVESDDVLLGSMLGGEAGAPQMAYILAPQAGGVSCKIFRWHAARQG